MKSNTDPFSAWHVGVAAEAIAAALFARCGLDVSVQYGANQPEYDLMVARDEQIIKVSVKGSKDGGWGLSQSQMEPGKADYQGAIDRWLGRHKPRTVLCFVQFQGVAFDQLPRCYLATPCRGGRASANNREGPRRHHPLREQEVDISCARSWNRREIPSTWRFSKERVEMLLETS